jgi:hypothetical protein
VETLNVEYKGTNLRFFAIHPASVPTRLVNVSEVTTPDILEKAPAMAQMLTHLSRMLKDKVDLPAYTALCLAHPDGRADPLKGRYVDSNHDLGEILKRINVVKEKRLYTLKADMFTTEHDLKMRKMFEERKKNASKL